ncbi:predicted protein [Coccidioides posadasii str. Silveira]|uniref:Predicted protein n=1 Tax=Coccidioides posadasii (strain RMSCC 757 / Silveira) TaxID=443226 RepID=E9DF08_COCPS|nr:predicted protein [Coccidioides posadasii str. Silveira]
MVHTPKYSDGNVDWPPRNSSLFKLALAPRKSGLRGGSEGNSLIFESCLILAPCLACKGSYSPRRYDHAAVNPSTMKFPYFFISNCHLLSVSTPLIVALENTEFGPVKT